MNHKLELGGGIPTWGPPQGRHTNIHFFQPAKSVLRSEAPHINNNSSPLVGLILFFNDFFSCWWNRPTVTINSAWMNKPGVFADCLTLCCQT